MALTVEFIPAHAEERILSEKPPIKLAGETYTEEEYYGHGFSSHSVVIDPDIEFVDSNDERIYRTSGVYETSNEMKYILALGEHSNIYIKDYSLEVDESTYKATIKFRELVKGNPLENENNTSTVKPSL